LNGGEFAGWTPERLIEYQRLASTENRYRLLDLVQSFVAGIPGRQKYKMTIYSHLRSFFLHSRAELPMDKSFHLQPTVTKVQGTLSVEDLRDVLQGCNIMYRAIYLSVFMAGMGRGELIHWSNHGLDSLREQLGRDESVITIELPGRKKLKYIRPFYTFVSGDALDALRAYWLQRPRGGSSIFLNKYGRPVDDLSLGQYWIRHLRRRGLVQGLRQHGLGRSFRTGKNLHELRDLYRTQWAKSPAKPEVAEFCMGHSIDPLEYNKSYRDREAYRREYLKALPWLNVLTSHRPFRVVDEAEVDRLRERVDKYEAEAKKLVDLEQELARVISEVEDMKRVKEDGARERAP
jgi:integrase